MGDIPSYLSEHGDTRRRNLRSKKQEKKLARGVGGHRIAGSGSGRNKGDVESRVFKIEAKRTDKEAFHLRKVYLDKIEQEAFAVGRIPALAIEMRNTRWVMIRETEFYNMIEYFNQK